MAEVETSFAQAKSYLMKADAEGNSVYDHLYNLVYTVLEENPGDVVNHPEKFAELSAATKKHLFAHGPKASASNCSSVVPAEQLAKAQQNRTLFDQPPPEVVTKIEQPTPYTTITTTTIVPRQAPKVKSLVTESQLWRYAGVSLPEQELFLLDLSISRLAEEKKLEDVRFVGKIFGIRGNYIVVSSKRYVSSGEEVFEEVNNMPKPPRKKIEVDVQPEPAYKGCNRLSFWVTSDASSPWKLLPDITPQQINAARKVKKFFTGDLDASVQSYPAFPWSEGVYLRAQLSRIVSACVIAPNGAVDKVEPEEDEPEDDDQPKKLKVAKYVPLTKVNKDYTGDDENGVAALVDTDQWVHVESYIYETGRQTKVPPKPEVEGEEEPPQEEEEEEVEKKEEEERELFQPVKKDSLYAVINLPKEPNPDGEEEPEPETAEPEGEGEEKEEEDKEEIEEDIPDDDPLRKKIYAWNAFVVNGLYKKHGVCVVRSLRWPGAIAYAAQNGKVWGSVYFGYGTKKTDHAFTPVPATQIEKECDDILEVMDPTAANEKLVLRGEEPKEADSEDEKDEDEEAQE
jgi:hypothetical protein